MNHNNGVVKSKHQNDKHLIKPSAYVTRGKKLFYPRQQNALYFCLQSSGCNALQFTKPEEAKAR